VNIADVHLIMERLVDNDDSKSLTHRYIADRFDIDERCMICDQVECPNFNNCCDVCSDPECYRNQPTTEDDEK
jgi:hypothetical protein